MPRNRGARSRSDAWTQLMYDPAFSLGPFLQIPPYLPSGFEPSSATARWYGKVGPQFPSAGVDFVAKPAPSTGAELIAKRANPGSYHSLQDASGQMNADAPSFVPGLYQDVCRQALQLRHPSGLCTEAPAAQKPPKDKHQDSHMLAIRAAERTASRIGLDASSAFVSAECLARSVTSSTLGSTSTASLDDSVRGGQGDGAVSGGSEITSEEVNDIMSQQSSQYADQRSHINEEASPCSTLAAEPERVVDAPSKSASEKEDAKDTEADKACASKAVDDSLSIAHPFGGMFSYDGSFIPDSDLLVIDPEAANPTAVNIASECKPVAADPAPEDVAQIAKGSGSTSNSIVSKMERAGRSSIEIPQGPSLDIVIGYWRDGKNSHYEVSFDDGSDSSCRVKTTRPGGLVRETSALIRHGQLRGKSAGRIIWGSAFVLEMPIESSDTLEWKSMRNGRDFTWTRVTDGDEGVFSVDAATSDTKEAAKQVDSAIGKRTGVEADRRGKSNSSSNEPDYHGHVKEFEESKENDDGFYSSGNTTTSTRRRVWRAVSSKDPVARHRAAEGPVITPSEVAAAPCRRVQSHSGEWRVIKKGPQTIRHRIK